jgi:predicted nucleic acid-binding protein
MILDTNALSALFDGDEALRRMLGREIKISLPVVVLGEYRSGLIGSRKKGQIEPDLDVMQGESNILSVDAETAMVYAKIFDQLKRVGKPIPSNDIWIAALAVQYNLPIVSRDRHFDHVPGVRRLTW